MVTWYGVFPTKIHKLDFMFSKKTKSVALNESTTTAVELCIQAITTILETRAFVVKTAMKISAKQITESYIQLKVKTTFQHKSKLFDFELQATIMKGGAWDLLYSEIKDTAVATAFIYPKEIVSSSYCYFKLSRADYMRFSLTDKGSLGAQLLMKKEHGFV